MSLSTTKSPVGQEPVASTKSPAAAASEKSGGQGSIPSNSQPSVTVKDSEQSKPTTASGGSGSGDGSGMGRGSGQSVVARGTSRPQSYILTTRPVTAKIKVGNKGAAFNAYTNAFKIQKRPNWSLVQHRVDFKPEEDNTKVKRGLLRQLDSALNCEYIFDGTMLFSTKRLDGQSFTTQDPTSNSKFQINFKEVGEVQPTDFTYVQLLNILVRKVMEKLQMAQVGRDYFDPKAAVNLKEYKLDLWPGYVTSIRQHEQDMLLCSEMKMKIMRSDSVLENMSTIMKANKTNFKSAIGRALIGMRVITKYNNKTYAIDDVNWDLNPEKTFDNKGKPTSYSQYFKQRYNLDIKDKKQPLLISNPTAQMRRAGITTPISLIPELCNMTGLSDEQRADFKLMKAVMGASASAPPERIKALQRFSQRVVSVPAIKDELLRWDLKFEATPAKLVGRTLTPEEICTGKGKKGSYKMENADWGGQVGRNFTLWGGVNCASWAVVYPKRDGQDVGTFVNSLAQLSASMGLMFQSPPIREEVDSTRTPDIKKGLDNVLNKGVRMVVVVIPNNKSDAYAMVKKTCLLNKPTPSQVVTGTVLKKWVPKGIQSVATKIAIQMACKLGGEPWTVPIPVKGLMVIGYDTWHDASQKGRSVGAVVATINPSLSRFVSYVTFHTQNEECIAKIGACVAKALKEYQKNNGSLPERVVVYRDGVGDGQIAQTKNMEVGKIREAFKQVGCDPKFTYVIVTKRVNTRFYKMDGNNAVNPPSGSIFDDVVTLPERYDFYLVSQSVRQGTVNPTSYNIIEDTSLWPANIIQLLTYKLTHLYFNWPGTVRVPMVCQYAHKLAYLVGESVHNQPSDTLETLLYYL